MQKLTTCLWFNMNGEEAAEYYTSIFPDSKIVAVGRYTDAGPGPAGTAMVVEFELAGQTFTALNGGPDFTFSEAISIQVSCEDQDEVDYYWTRLTEGGEEGPCGWLKDRYGLSWQVCPNVMDELLNDPDRERSQRAVKAMMGMKKLDIAALLAAADG
jgi:predicted 3-demethylubiquinone-9 3-methyltransferase (glyoxalase superfamily)